MKRNRSVAAAALAAIFSATVLLSGWTFFDFLEAHRPLQEFRAQLLEVSRGESLRRFDALFLFENAAEQADVEMDFMSISLLYRGEVLASGSWFPDDMRLGPGAKTERVIELEARVPERLLRDLEDDPDLWLVRGTLRIRRPGAERDFPIHMRQNPAGVDVRAPVQ